MKKFALCFVLMFSPVLFGADVTIPDKLQTEAGLPVEIVAKTDGKMVKWFAVSGDEKRKCFIFTTKENGSRAIFVAPKEGTYYVYAFTATGDVPSDPVLAVVIVGATPGPIVPPIPPPIPPSPELDAFQKELQALYTANTEADKAESKIALAKLYRYMASLDPVPTTQGAMMKTFINVAPEFKAAGKLRPIQLKASTDVIEKQMPGGDTTPVDKAKMKTVFNYLADSMEKLK